MHLLENRVRSILCVHSRVTALYELFDGIEPQIKRFRRELVKRLERGAVVSKDAYTNLAHLAVRDAGLEVLLGKRKRRVDGAKRGLRSIEDRLHVSRIEHEVAMQKQNVLPAQFLPREVHGVDVVRLAIDRIRDESKARATALEPGGDSLELLLERPRGHHEVADSALREDSDLAAEDRLSIRELHHALWIVRSQLPEAAPQAGVEDESLHFSNPLLRGTDAAHHGKLVVPRRDRRPSKILPRALVGVERHRRTIEAFQPLHALCNLTSGPRLNNIRETASTKDARNVDIASGQRGRSENHRGMLVVALLETAGQRAEAFAVQLDGRAHLDQRFGEAETVLIHGFMHD